MRLASLRWLPLACVMLACGPSVGGETTHGDASGSTSAASTTSPLPASTGADETSRGGSTTETHASSSESTGPSGVPVECFVDGNIKASECCPQLPKPCPTVQHECRACQDPLNTPVTDPMTAQCMLAALAEGNAPAVYDRVVYWGLGSTHEQWIVAASGDVTLLSWESQDLAFDYGFETCRLIDAEVLTTCSMQSDPQVLAGCLEGALEGCEEATDPVCPG